METVYVNTELKTSAEWNEMIGGGVNILDPDGWDRSNWEFSWHQEKISKKEFGNRVFLSTIESSKVGMDIFCKWIDS